jgi:hypothetical protein
MTIRKLSTMEDNALPVPSGDKPKRNRTDLSITNGFEFGIGFWLASVLVLVFGVPILTCVALIAVAVLGRFGQQ